MRKPRKQERSTVERGEDGMLNEIDQELKQFAADLAEGRA